MFPRIKSLWVPGLACQDCTKTIPFGASQRRQQCRPGPGGRARGGRHCCYLRCSAGATGTASTGHVLATSNRITTLQSWRPSPSLPYQKRRSQRQKVNFVHMIIRRLSSSPPGRNRCEFCSGPFDLDRLVENSARSWPPEARPGDDAATDTVIPGVNAGDTPSRCATDDAIFLKKN